MFPQPRKKVVAYDDFKAHNNNQPSMAGAKAAGKYRIEGKNYEVKDGDIVSLPYSFIKGVCSGGFGVIG